MNTAAAQSFYDDRIAVERIRKRRQPKAPGAFLTIGEVADQLQLEQHVLRFWESKFAEIQPVKRAGGRRYYRPADVELLKRIRSLLYVEGYTIRGVQHLLGTENTPAEIRMKTPEERQRMAVVNAVDSTLLATQEMLQLDTPEKLPPAVEPNLQREKLEELMKKLLEIRELVSAE